MAIEPAKNDFNALVSVIQHVHKHLYAQAGKAVNISLTLRNWLIGCYIAEYELNGSDRATYDDELLQTLSDRLTSLSVSNSHRSQFYDYPNFYCAYPRIVKTVSAQLVLPAEKFVEPDCAGTADRESRA